jgi:hypothetical protein
MLVSHKYKFIFLKAKKVSGTSTEAFLERYCLSDEQEKIHKHTHEVSEQESEYGIIGNRVTQIYDKWYNHKPALELKRDIGDDIWNNYKKICNIRNPFDIAVSYYCRQHPMPANKQMFEKFLKDPETIKYLLTNKAIWSINGEFSHDFYIRQENLEEDLSSLIKELNLPFYDLDIPTYKMKHKRPHYSAYYSFKSRNIIETYFKEELKYFGYKFEIK